MATWHETMMKSSDSFRECHENKNGGNEPLVDDYISISDQGNNHYWSIYEPATALEVTKFYEVVINDETHKLMCTKYNGYPALVSNRVVIQYNSDNGRYLIHYYPNENIGSNPTVNFSIKEVNYESETLRPFNINTSGFNGNSTELGDGVINAFLIGRPINVISEGAQTITVNPVTHIELPIDYNYVNLSYGDNQVLEIKCSNYEYELVNILK